MSADRRVPATALAADEAAPPIGFGYVADELAVPPALSRRIRRTIWAGALVSAVFVVGLGAWAAVAPVSGAVPAQGVVTVENNRKTIKHLESGVLRRILVHDGEHVTAGQVLFVFDDSQARAQTEVLRASYDSLLAEHARFEAEARGAPSIQFPPELLARRDDPAVAAVIASQEALFAARRDTLASQVSVGDQRVRELATQIQGLKAQVAAIDTQAKLNDEELGGVSKLYSGGYAPKTRLLSLQRSAASLEGSRGEQVAAVARAEQTIGETRVQILATRQTRIAEAAAGLEETQEKIADVQPRLAAAQDALARTEVRSPVDGYILNQSQFTEGAAVGGGEPLADVVPSNAPLVIQVQVRPRDVHAVHPGQRSLITLSAYNSRTTPRIEAEVLTVAADQTMPQTTPASAQLGGPARAPYFLVEMRIPPDQLKRLPKDVTIYPGMPVSTSIVTGRRSVLDYIMEPIRDAFRESLHES